jgi:hypothetical protein
MTTSAGALESSATGADSECAPGETNKDMPQGKAARMSLMLVDIFDHSSVTTRGDEAKQLLALHSPRQNVVNNWAL